MDGLFRKSLTDLVRGIRANKKDENKFITKCLQEIKEELRMVDKKVKVVAIQKLTYLQMLGYDMTWAAFNVVEVMSQESFSSKRVGYLAAVQSFRESTEVVMLTTNLFKKDITSVNQYETGVALNALANVCTPDLAQDLAADVLSLVSSSKPYVRKKAILCLYKIFLKFPQALRPSYPRLREKLDDPDMSVISSSVNVICELARRNPNNYLTLAPTFFKLLSSSNNWMLIKIIKLFGALTPLEKRLAKKLVGPLTDIMNSTNAMSLLYECIQTCTIGLTAHVNVIRLCIAKLRLFIEDPDQNLKYLGLLALYNIMQAHPKAVTEHRDMVIFCLDDEDVTIRQRALDLLTGMVGKRNLMDIIQKLMEKLEDAEGAYRDDLVEKVITICSQNNYQHVTDFEWYINVLMELTHIGNTTHGNMISDQFMDVCIRVQMIRECGVKNMINLLRDPRLMGENPKAGGVCEVLYAAAYIVGEFGSQAKNPMATLEALLQPQAVSLPGHIQSAYVHNSLKVLSHIGAQEPHNFRSAVQFVEAHLPPFTQSFHLEVQERACFALELVKLLSSSADTQPSIIEEFASIFADALNPVAPRAQRKVPVPEGIDLDRQINEPPVEVESDDDDRYLWGTQHGEDDSDDDQSGRRRHHRHPGRHDDEPSAEDRERTRRARRQKQAMNPYYLGGSSPLVREADSDDERFPVQTLTNEMLDSPSPLSADHPHDDPPSSSRRGVSIKRGRPTRHKRPVVLTTVERPDGMSSDSDNETQAKGTDELSQIDLTSELRPEEMLTTRSYPIPGSQSAAPAAPAAAAAGAPGDERRRRRSRRDRDGKAERGEEDRDRRHRSGRRREGDRESRSKDSTKKSASSAAPTTSSGNLLDMGFASTAPVSAAAAATATASGSASSRGSSGSLLDFGAVSSPSPAPAAAPVAAPAAYSQVDSPAMANFASRSTPEERDDRRQRSRRGRDDRGERGERGERRSRDDRGERGERGERRSRDERSGGGSERRHRSRRDEDSGSSEPAAGGAPSEFLAGKNSDTRVTYSLLINPAEPNKVLAVVQAINTSNQPVSNMAFAVTDTLNTKLVQPADLRPVGSIAPGGAAPARLMFTFSSFVRPQVLNGSFSYSVGGASRTLELSFTFPTSTFVQPRDVTEDQFSTILTSGTQFHNATASVSVSDTRKAIGVLIDLLHLRVAFKNAEAVALYGQSIQGHHVCLLAKQQRDGLGLSLKTTDSTLSSSLMNEASQALSRV